jgi:hypothetical protein
MEAGYGRFTVTTKPRTPNEDFKKTLFCPLTTREQESCWAGLDRPQWHKLHELRPDSRQGYVSQEEVGTECACTEAPGDFLSPRAGVPREAAWSRGLGLTVDHRRTVVRQMQK